MRSLLAFIIALVAFGAFFVLLDLMLFGAQGLSLIYKG